MQELDWNQVVTHLYQLGIAFVLALPVAWNREQRARGAGLRTFPLVSIAACGYMLVGMQVYSGSDAEARVMYGIITGMGFIGGGAIGAVTDQLSDPAVLPFIQTASGGRLKADGRYRRFYAVARMA